MIVYKASNNINGKCYVGQTIHSLEYRKQKHFNRMNRRSNQYFYNALRKYGFDAFFWEILCECNTKEELDEKEKYYIKYYNSFMDNNGYNMTVGGDKGTLGWCPSKETRKRMSDSAKKRPSPMKGKHHTESAKKEMSKRRRGVVAWTKLLETDVRNILDLYHNKKIILPNVGMIQQNGIKMSYRRAFANKIHDKYNVTVECIEKIVNGVTWKNVQKEYKI